MRRRRRIPHHANHERWLVSYADFITLLFAFFVVLYAASQVDKKKVGMLAVAIQTAFQQMGVFQTSTVQSPVDASKPLAFGIENKENPGSRGHIASSPEGSSAGAESGDLAELQAELETALAPQIKLKEITMRSDPDGLVISLQEVGFFESGSLQMKSASKEAFDHVASMLRQRNYRLRIEGHTDNVPIHTSQFPSNWELSSSRATEVVRLLIVRDGFPPDRLSAGGFAEYHPVASNSTAEGRGQNRRVDIVVLGSTLNEAPLAKAPPQVQVPAVNLPVTKTPQPQQVIPSIQPL